MSISQMTLPTDKNRKPVIGITVRQGDKKGKMDVYLLDANNSPYNLTDKTLVFIEQKSNNKWIVDSKDTNFNIVDKVRGHFTYQLNDAVDAIGTGRAWFEIQSSDGTKDSSQTFSIDVEQGLSMAITNSNYISEFEDLRAKLNDIIKNAQDTLSKENTDFLNQTKSIIASLQTTFSNLEKSFQSSFNSQTASINSAWTSDKARIDKEWSDDKSRIDSEWTTQKSSIQSYADKQHTDINNAWSTQTNKIASEWSSQHSTIQSTADKQHTDIDNAWDAQTKSIDSQWAQKKASLDATISQLSIQLTSIQNSLTDLSNNKLPAMDKYADTVQAKVDKLRADFNSIDFSSYATKMDLNNAIAANKPEGTVVTGYDIDSNTKTTAHVKYADKFLVGGEILSTFADAIQRLRGTGTHKITNAVDVNTLTGEVGTVSSYIAINSANTNTPPFFNDQRGTLIVANYDGNAKTQIWIPVGTPAMSGAGFAYRYLQGPIVNDWQKVNAGEIADALTKANNALSRNGGNMTVKSTINWQGINTVEANQGNLGGLYWGGGSDWLKIYGDNNGNDNLDLAMDLGDDGSNHISFRWNGAEKAGITSNGKFTGNIDWANINGRPMFMPITRGQSNEDVLAFKTNQIRMYVSVSGVKNLPANLSNKTWFSVQYVFENESNDGVAILRTPANEVWINSNNGGSYGVWHRYLNDVDYNTLSSQITELKNKMPDIHTVSTEAEGTTYLASHPNAIIFVKG